MLPAAIMTYGFGLILAATPGVVDWRRGWIWSKLGLVILLTFFHFLLARWRRDFAAGKNAHSAKFYRVMNELPTIAMIAIVLFVVAKPF
jgi:putative membrane protein